MNGCSRCLVALLLLCLAGCGSDRTAATQPAPVADGTVVELGPNEPTLALADIGMSLKESMGLVNADQRPVPFEIEVEFVNKSAQRGVLPLVRPVVEGKDYEESLPCLCIGVREVEPRDHLVPRETLMLYTLQHGRSAGNREGVILEPGSKFSRKFELDSFCLIGHGIATATKNNFSRFYSTGNDRFELRTFLIADWNKLTRVESNPIEVRVLSARDIDWSKELEELSR